jgi:Tfp pilus assembly protein PilF
VSLINDALRRSARPAAARNREGDRAEGVIAALGYRSEPRRGSREWMPVAVAALIVAAVGVWLWWPGLRRPTSDGRSATSAVRRPTTEVRTPKLEDRGPKEVPGAVVARSPATPAQPPPVVATSSPEAPHAAAEPAGAPVGGRGTRLRLRGPADLGLRTWDLGPRSPAVAEASARKPDDFQLGLYYQRAGDFEQALMHYRAALQRDEMNVEAHNNLGHLYLGRGLADEAAREFQRVIAIEPRYVTARVNLSAALYALGRFDAAAAQAHEALQLDPKSGAAYVNLALAQKAAGQAGDAQLSLRRALELDPRNPAAHYNLARQFEESGEAAPALDHYRQFLQYAGPEQSGYAQDVRTRIATLQGRMK